MSLRVNNPMLNTTSPEPSQASPWHVFSREGQRSYKAKNKQKNKQTKNHPKTPTNIKSSKIFPPLQPNHILSSLTIYESRLHFPYNLSQTKILHHASIHAQEFKAICMNLAM